MKAPGHPDIAKLGEKTRFKPGQIPNPNGRPPGKSLSTLIRELGEDENFNWDLVPIKDREKAKKLGSPWRAILMTAIARSYSGDVKAMRWLSKTGYGDKLDITSGGKAIQQPLIVSEIKKRYVPPEAETTESS